jgi:hypothetical protein
MYLTFPNMKLPGKIIITVLLCVGSIMGYSQVDTQFWFAAPDLQQAQATGPYCYGWRHPNFQQP